GVDCDEVGCVAREVAARIGPRGTGRRRGVQVGYDGFAPEVGARVSAGEKALGTLGSTAQGRGLALLRLDRTADALAAGEPLIAGDAEMRLVKPSWARFPFPGEGQAAR